MIDWSKIPDHMDWAAMDESRMWYAFWEKPIKKTSTWMINNGNPNGESYASFECEDSPPWEESLTYRDSVTLENVFKL